MRNRSNQFKLYNTKKSLVFVPCDPENLVIQSLLPEKICGGARFTVFKVKSYNCHKNKIRTNEPKIWQNNKNTEPQPKLSGSYKKKKV